ncbi:nucleotide pyrophosphohydrolase [Candidatus Sumerlaeota bacterium]|nr:nucleotide pyrophosphohydrolase [Candidatus Sumerlaeota bacterium]
MTLKGAQKIVEEWIQTIGVRYFSELTNLAVLMEEVGELARLFARRFGDQCGKASEPDATLDEELADVLFVLICLANQTGVDLEAALRRSLDKKTHRDSERHRDNPKLRS